MATPFRILAAPAALAFACLATAVPALAQPAPAVVPPDGEACAPMMARWQSAEAQYSAMTPSDLDSYNVVQNAIDRAAHFCQAGQDDEAKAIMERSKDPRPALQ